MNKAVDKSVTKTRTRVESCMNEKLVDPILFAYATKDIVKISKTLKSHIFTSHKRETLIILTEKDILERIINALNTSEDELLVRHCSSILATLCTIKEAALLLNELNLMKNIKIVDSLCEDKYIKQDLKNMTVGLKDTLKDILLSRVSSFIEQREILSMLLLLNEYHHFAVWVDVIITNTLSTLLEIEEMELYYLRQLEKDLSWLEPLMTSIRCHQKDPQVQRLGAQLISVLCKSKAIARKMPKHGAMQIIGSNLNNYSLDVAIVQHSFWCLSGVLSAIEELHSLQLSPQLFQTDIVKKQLSDFDLEALDDEGVIIPMLVRKMFEAKKAELSKGEGVEKLNKASELL